MDHRLLAKACFIVIVFSCTIFAGASGTKTLDSLLVEAIKANPDIKRLQTNLKVFESRIEPAGTLPDPQLSLGIFSLPTDSYHFDQEPMTQKSIGLKQAIPFFGKLSLKKDLAKLDRQIASAQLDGIELEIIRMVKTTYYDLYFMQMTEQITRDNQALLDNVVAVSEIKYRTGQGIQANWLNSRVERLKLDEQLTVLKTQQSALRSKMNILLNQAPDAALPAVIKLPKKAANISIEEIRQQVLQKNPLLLTKNLQIDKSSASEKLARRNYWPDFSASINYGQRIDRPDFISGIVSLNIPLFAAKKQKHYVQEAQALQDRSRYDFQQSKNQLLLEIQFYYDELTKNNELQELYKNNLIPQAELAYQSALTAYSNDRFDYTSLMNNLMALFKYQLEYEKMRIAEYKAAAELEALAGIGN